MERKKKCQSALPRDDSKPISLGFTLTRRKKKKEADNDFTFREIICEYGNVILSNCNVKRRNFEQSGFELNISLMTHLRQPSLDRNIKNHCFLKFLYKGYQ